MTNRLKRSGLGLPIIRGVVVDRQAFILASQTEVGQLWDTLEGTVASAEVQARGPVVGEIIGVGARRARRQS